MNHILKISLFFLSLSCISCISDQTISGETTGNISVNSDICISNEISQCLLEETNENQAISICLNIQFLNKDQKYLLKGSWSAQEGLTLIDLDKIKFKLGDPFESRLYFLKDTENQPSCQSDDQSLANQQILDLVGCQDKALDWCLLSLYQPEVIFNENLESIEFTNAINTCSVESQIPACQKHNCFNMFQDLGESDIDCGGEICDQCVASEPGCKVDDDCMSRCVESKCCADRDEDRICDDQDLCPDIKNANTDDMGHFTQEQITQFDVFSNLGYMNLGDPTKGAHCSDYDADGIIDIEDNCPDVSSSNTTNTYLQSDRGDVCDDTDLDGVVDSTDQCALVPNPNQEDLDGDLKGDACDDDIDADRVQNEGDNCVYISNPDQRNTDLTLQADPNSGVIGDEYGDDCDLDDDNDNTDDVNDNCPLQFNPTQDNVDMDEYGDICDMDMDNDFTLNENDNCPIQVNANQQDNDNDRLGDVCDEDDDNDGVLDADDNCLLFSNIEQLDLDLDRLGDVCDNDRDGDNIINNIDLCPDLRLASNTNNHGDLDGDLVGDDCDEDQDNDGFYNDMDNCPLIFNANQANLIIEEIQATIDNIGDLCDPDDDKDGVLDINDNCPRVYNPIIPPAIQQEDIDGDGIGDACSDDSDGDGIEENSDNCPNDANLYADIINEVCPDGLSEACVNQYTTFNPSQEDLDLDGLGDVCDSDKDGDNKQDKRRRFQRIIIDEGRIVGFVRDNDFFMVDNCPLIFNPYQEDLDLDFIGDDCDDDDDNDGIIDVEDNCPFVMNAGQEDFDSDFNLASISNPYRGGDACDDDDDNDGVDDVNDGNSLNPSICIDQDLDGCNDCSATSINDFEEGSNVDIFYDGIDNDLDGMCNIGDNDDDNDGVDDVIDPFPFDPSRCSDYDRDTCDDCAATSANNFSVGSNVDVGNDGADSDFDGVCNNSDTDDDNDNYSDSDEITCGSNPIFFGSKPIDTDNDGLCDSGVDPDDDNDTVLDVNELPLLAPCDSDYACLSNFCLCVDVGPVGGCHCDEIF